MSNLLLCCGTQVCICGINSRSGISVPKDICIIILINTAKWSSMRVVPFCTSQSNFFQPIFRGWMVYCCSYSLHFSLYALDGTSYHVLKAFCSSFFCEMSVPIFILGRWLFSQSLGNPHLLGRFTLYL